MKTLGEGPFRVGAVSYLNTEPLVWGMQYGAQASLVDLSFSIPSVCAQMMQAGQLDLGLLPVAEIARQELTIVPGVGITCRGVVRSILLFSRVPWSAVRTLAADASSRTSVHLAKVVLRERFGTEPVVKQEAPELTSMLSHSDAALIIGDPALHLDPETLPYKWLDLGQEWFKLTNLPMVFAAWATRTDRHIEALRALTLDSYEAGRTNLDAIVEDQPRTRGISRELASIYLRKHIRFEIGREEQRGLEAFLDLAGLANVGVTAAKS